MEPDWGNVILDILTMQETLANEREYLSWLKPLFQTECDLRRAKIALRSAGRLPHIHGQVNIFGKAVRSFQGLV